MQGTEKKRVYGAEEEIERTSFERTPDANLAHGSRWIPSASKWKEAGYMGRFQRPGGIEERAEIEEQSVKRLAKGSPPTRSEYARSSTTLA